MNKLAILVWCVIATVLAGSFIVVVLVVPELAEQEMKFIPIAVLSGMLTALPISYFITKKVTAL